MKPLAYLMLLIGLLSLILTVVTWVGMIGGALARAFLGSSARRTRE